ncbi:hypothetical protein ERJ75_000397900 [Trypanosoma vivax]|nr:hypothetical protein ERJ75_000397900 [Trypanosoma vivax]
MASVVARTTLDMIARAKHRRAPPASASTKQHEIRNRRDEPVVRGMKKTPNNTHAMTDPVKRDMHAEATKEDSSQGRGTVFVLLDDGPDECGRDASGVRERTEQHDLDAVLGQRAENVPKLSDTSSPR